MGVLKTEVRFNFVMDDWLLDLVELVAVLQSYKFGSCVYLTEVVRLSVPAVLIGRQNTTVDS